MTVLDAANKLLDFYQKNDSFNIEKNYQDLILISDSPEDARIAINLALEDLEKNDIIKCFSAGKSKTYILKKPLNNYDQNVLVGGITANMVAKIINDFCDKIKDKRDYCDARSITEKDIRNLIFLASMATTEKDQSLD